MMNAVLAVIVLTGIALLVGAVRLRMRGGSLKQIALMLVLVAVIAANIAIWTLPNEKGDTLIDEASRQGH